MLATLMMSKSIPSTFNAPHVGREWTVYAQDRAEALE
jgi:hypothetical protein